MPPSEQEKANYEKFMQQKANKKAVPLTQTQAGVNNYTPNSKNVKKTPPTAPSKIGVQTDLTYSSKNTNNKTYTYTPQKPKSPKILNTAKTQNSNLNNSAKTLQNFMASNASGTTMQPMKYIGTRKNPRMQAKKNIMNKSLIPPRKNPKIDGTNLTNAMDKAEKYQTQDNTNSLKSKIIKSFTNRDYWHRDIKPAISTIISTLQR